MIEESKYLPHIYWLPKLQKNSTKARFIIAAPKSSLKSFSKTITVVFKIPIHQTESCNDQLQYVSGIINFRTLNNQPVMKGVDSTNRRTKAALNLSSDFSNLHANIPKLFKVLCELLERKRDFITIYKYGTRWTKQDKEYLPKFSNATLEQMRPFSSLCYHSLLI